MSNLISIWDVEMQKDKKISKKSIIARRALQLLEKNNNMTYDKDAKVVDFGEFILSCHLALKQYEKRLGNKNAKRV